MYPDPKRVRSHRITVRLDDYEHALLTALANYQGDELSTVTRELALREALQLLDAPAQGAHQAPELDRSVQRRTA